MVSLNMGQISGIAFLIGIMFFINWFKKIMSKLITIKSSLTSAEAHIIKGQLESFSVINAHAIFSDNIGQIELQVKEEDTEKALKLVEKK